MPFIKMPGLPGKVYIPKPSAARRQKHPCPDCFACQKCPESRCRVCRCGEGCREKPPPPDTLEGSACGA
ncbi:MAG: hypothetical protein PVI39_01035 [Desulfobacteraceae bacterium]|jgi:hypothetical protein